MADPKAFFIEMGQGLVGQGLAGTPFCVRTSALYSCTLIAAYNESSGFAGAFHYPAGEPVSPAMNEWLHRIKPTRVIMVGATRMEGFANTGQPAADKSKLTEWLQASSNPAPSISDRDAAAAGMSLIRRGNGLRFYAGNIPDLEGFDDDADDDINLSGEQAGGLPYEGFRLYGQNEQITEGRGRGARAPATTAAAGRSSSRASSSGGCCSCSIT